MTHHVSGMDGDIAADLLRLRRVNTSVELPKAPRLGLIAAVAVGLGLIAGAIWVAVFPPPFMSPAAQAVLLAAMGLGAVATVALYASCVVEKHRREAAELRLASIHLDPGITWRHLRLAIRERIYENSDLEAEAAERVTEAIMMELLSFRKEIAILLMQQGDPKWT